MAFGTAASADAQALADEGQLASADVAIVHDYLNQRGGAERVALELARMWPAATIYTSLYRPDSTFPEFRRRRIRTSPIDRLPVDRAFRALLPLYPAAFRALGEIDADIVVASSSGWGHLARARADALRVVYCHTPARWLYGHRYACGHGGTKYALARPLLGTLARIDRAAAHAADLYIANSEHIRRAIRAAYGFDSLVIPPAVEVDRFSPTERGQRLLIVSRLLPYKRIDSVVRAAGRLGIGLDIVGVGPALRDLRQAAGPRVTFHGAVSDEEVVELMEGAAAVCVPGEEDFGIVSVEAQAAGKPVIAYGRGGSLETVEEGFSGVFFHDHREESIIAAVRAADRLRTAPVAIATRARKFSPKAFEARLNGVLAAALREHEAAALARPRALGAA